MSFTNPGLPKIVRKSVVGEENEWVKMFDPPTESPATRELMAPTNPVPEVMFAAGFQNKPSVPHTVMRDLLDGLTITTWDNRPGGLKFFTIGDGDNPALSGGTYPAGTIRVPRGVIFHGKTKGHGPPPHTIHWHGIEPTPMNDGVGHCSQEVGDYIYQWQPNFIGHYFYHCHRNTPQHFEFGLFGLLLIETPDAYFASLNPDGTLNNNIPIGAGRDGLRRIAANIAEVLLPDGTLASFTGKFPGFNSSPIDAPDPLGQFPVHPHAMTVPFDVEALWVFDERDSRWSDLAPGAFTTFPKHGDQPGVNDRFHENVGKDDPATPVKDNFFAFNDFHPDYFFVTGVPVPAPAGSTVTIDPAGAPPTGGGLPGGLIPPALNSGVSGSQVAINAQVNQTILVRALDAAYSRVRLTVPLDMTIISWDGRSLGIPPFTRYNKAFLLPANTPLEYSVARRINALIRETNTFNGFAKVEFLNTRADGVVIPEDVVMTARIPINITAAATFAISGRVTSRRTGAPLAGVTMTLTGAAGATTTTGGDGTYSFQGLANGSYTVTPSQGLLRFIPGSLNVTINGAIVANQNFQGA